MSRKLLFPTWPITFVLLMIYAVLIGDAVAAEEPLYIAASFVGLCLCIRLLLRGL